MTTTTTTTMTMTMTESGVTRRRRSEAGVGLVELLVTMAVFGVVLTATMAVLVSLIGITRTAAVRTATTADARILLERSDELYARWEEIHAEVAEADPEPGGTLRLCGFSTAASRLLPPAAAGLRDAYPRLTVRIMEAEPDRCFDLLLAEEADLALLVVTADSPPMTDGRFDQQCVVVGNDLHDRLRGFDDVADRGERQLVDHARRGCANDTAPLKVARRHAAHLLLVQRRIHRRQLGSGFGAAGLLCLDDLFARFGDFRLGLRDLRARREHEEENEGDAGDAGDEDRHVLAAIAPDTGRRERSLLGVEGDDRPRRR